MRKSHRWAWILAMVLGVAGTLRAEDVAPAKDVNQYLEQLQLKLDHAAQRANQPSATGASVVGVRGSPQEPMSKRLYWKGKTGSKPVSADEIKIFRAAVEQARTGDATDAVAALKAFQEKYPKSALGPDVQETLLVLGAVPKS